jgi:O-methyltransferase involved in polyketide biosynthesis
VAELTAGPCPYDSCVPDFDPRTPSIARVYDYLLGGKDNFAADREAGDRVITAFPAVVEAARENRQFLARAVAWVANQGVGQFIDLGCGMPTEPNTHQTAQAVNPGARVAYVDNDAVVVTHLRAVAAKGSPGVTVVVGDVADPDAILGAVFAGLDPAAPTCLIMGLLLHFYDPGTALSLVARYCAALVPGSYVLISMAHGNGEEGERWFSAYSAGPAPARNYSVAEITALFDGTELVPPGVVDARQWHPGWSDVPALPFRIGQAICGVGRIS